MIRALLPLCLMATAFWASQPSTELSENVNVAQNLAKPVRLRVVLEPRHRTEISAQVSSPVKIITKKLGETFDEGELLIQLDNRIFEGNVVKAAAEVEKAEVEYEAKKQLYQDRIGSYFDLKFAEAKLQAAKAELIIAEEELKATQIQAPYRGKVVDVEVEEYELPVAGAKLIEVVDDTVLVAKILLPADLLNFVKVGTPFRIRIQETGNEVEATVSRLGAVIDPASSTLMLEAQIPNEDGELVPGMRGTAYFEKER
ncbi:MAG: hypothetical protein Tsb0021_18050 [Chlamydiales bacterium]